MAKPKGYPAADVGSWEAVGLDENVCFDRVGRLGPYGLDTDLPASGGKARSAVAWDKVQWGKLQDECVLRNKLRYEDSAVPSLRPGKNEPGQGDVEPAQGPEKPVERPEEHAEGKADIKDKRQGSSSTVKKIGQKHKTRTAILIRTWDKYEYRDNDMQAVRSLIAEASLLSGGEYHVFLFVNVKNMDRAIFTDDAAYEKAMNDFVPEEFRSIAVLWNEQVCQEWYPKVGEWAVYWQQFMPLQWFSKTHPEFEYIWNWEMDARLIGQHYHFMEQVGDFAAKQPRKYLWERNARFFLPAVHGKYSKYFDDTNKIVKLAKAAKYLQTVWGPQPWAPEQILTGPKPPTSEEEDNFTWGVGEEADLLTLLPLWDPRETFWSYRDKLFNFPRGPDSYDERPYPHVPRRVFINTLARFSKKMLHAMHLENKAGLSMASEMWPGSVALQHGLKTVYAPHPIWLAQIWPGEYMDAVYNADGWGAGGLPGGTTDDGRGRNYNRQLEIAGLPQAGTGPNREGLAGRWSQERDAPYSPDREHNFGGWSWYFWSDFPKVIYWRWLGWKAGFSIVTIKGVEVTDELGIIGGGEFEREHGRMCLPPMLLHPVKNVKEPKPEVKEQEPKEEAKEAKEVKEQAKEPKEETKQPTEGEKPPSR
ncbi:hypothetical protein FH972_024596 [Carpinus fangiana]|uniref:Uncharacterized protein n=1 Tax=Carpinus fangiana TaxID=176857 RepID=A0A5N6KYZ4_9ROSI|nr:hypothetical protein FH972_024596 [Carpinus fangiana]